MKFKKVKSNSSEIKSFIINLKLIWVNLGAKKDLNVCKLLSSSLLAFAFKNIQMRPSFELHLNDVVDRIVIAILDASFPHHHILDPFHIPDIELAVAHDIDFLDKDFLVSLVEGDPFDFSVSEKGKA